MGMWRGREGRGRERRRNWLMRRAEKKPKSTHPDTQALDS